MSPKNQKKNNKNSKPYEYSIIPMLNRARHPTTKFQYVLSLESTLSSDGSGVMSGCITMDPSSLAEWSSFAAIFDQFRVLGGEVKLCSVLPVNSSANNSMMRLAFDNDSTTTPTSYADLASYSEVYDFPCVFTSGVIKKFAFRRPVTRGTPDEGNIWYNETTPSASPGGVKVYASGCAISTTYFKYWVDFLVEFQMRG